MSLEERFWSKVERSEPDECWLWRGTLTRGYGVLGRGRHGEGNVLAHRVAYELVTGSPPSGHLHHTCGNKTCVNPAHLKPVTQAQHSALHRKCDHNEPRYVHPDGRHSRCRACHREKVRERWRSDPEFREWELARSRAAYRARVTR